MRTLILLRHAAATTPWPDGGDFERALTPDGRAEAEAAGRLLAERGTRPQRLLTSPAHRARATADIVARCLGLARTGVEEDPALYLAAPAALRAAIAATDAAVGCLLLVGHNPGLSDLAADLDPAGEDVMLATGAFVRLELPLPDWSLP